MRRGKNLLLASATLPLGVLGQFYAQGVGRISVPATDAAANLKFLQGFLPVVEDSESCGTSCDCGVLGRVNLEPSASDVRPDPRPVLKVHDFLEGGFAGLAKGFGLQTVLTDLATSERSAGSLLTINDAEICLTAKIEAVEAGGYDAFLDNNMGFWTSNLDPYVVAFQNAGVPLVPVFWEQFGNEYYSFLVQVPGSLLVLELMSATQTMLPSPRYRSPHPRYTFPSADATPEATFGANLTDTAAARPKLYAVRVSQASSDLTRDRAFYTDVMGATIRGRVLLEQGGSTVIKAMAVDFAPLWKDDQRFGRIAGTAGGTEAYTQLHLIERSPFNTSLAPNSTAQAERGPGEPLLEPRRVLSNKRKSKEQKEEESNEEHSSSWSSSNEPAPAFALTLEELEEVAAEAEAEAENAGLVALPPACEFLSVPFFEEAMSAAHAEHVLSPQCGRDVWMDFALSLNDLNGRTQAQYLSALDEWTFEKTVDSRDALPVGAIAKTTTIGARYSILENAAGGVSLFILSPNGATVQVTNAPAGGLDWNMIYGGEGGLIKEVDEGAGSESLCSAHLCSDKRKSGAIFQEHKFDGKDDAEAVAAVLEKLEPELESPFSSSSSSSEEEEEDTDAEFEEYRLVQEAMEEAAALAAIGDSCDVRVACSESGGDSGSDNDGLSTTEIMTTAAPKRTSHALACAFLPGSERARCACEPGWTGPKCSEPFENNRLDEFRPIPANVDNSNADTSGYGSDVEEKEWERQPVGEEEYYPQDPAAQQAASEILRSRKGGRPGGMAGGGRGDGGGGRGGGGGGLRGSGGGGVGQPQQKYETTDLKGVGTRGGGGSRGAGGSGSSAEPMGKGMGGGAPSGGAPSLESLFSSFFGDGSKKHSNHHHPSGTASGYIHRQ